VDPGFLSPKRVSSTYDFGPALWLALEPKFYPFVTEFAFSDIFQILNLLILLYKKCNLTYYTNNFI
jgi:hypothetical protein